MGQAYCVNLCCQKTEGGQILFQLEHGYQQNGLQPSPSFAKPVKQQIQLKSNIKQIYMLYRKPHLSDRKGIALQLHYIFSYAAYYEGEWKNGYPHGQGRIIYDDGSLYEGCFNHGVADCHQALHIKEDESFYRGAVKDNKANGYGQLTTGKLFYKGPWLNDLPHGNAREIYSSISFYEGRFQKGVKQGAGVYQWNQNEYYVGDFANNRMHGKGMLVTKQYTYKGEFREGRKQGQGGMENNTTHWIYKGSFEMNEMSGRGRMEFSDGAVFEGRFLHNQRTSDGKLIMPNGEVIQGLEAQDLSSEEDKDQTFPISVHLMPVHQVVVSSLVKPFSKLALPD